MRSMHNTIALAQLAPACQGSASFGDAVKALKQSRRAGCAFFGDAVKALKDSRRSSRAFSQQAEGFQDNASFGDAVKVLKERRRSSLGMSGYQEGEPVFARLEGVKGPVNSTLISEASASSFRDQVRALAACRRLARAVMPPQATFAAWQPMASTESMKLSHRPSFQIVEQGAFGDVPFGAQVKALAESRRVHAAAWKLAQPHVEQFDVTQLAACRQRVREFVDCNMRSEDTHASKDLDMNILETLIGSQVRAMVESRSAPLSHA